MIKFIVLVVPIIVFTDANAFDINDCIINGMKGVSSDVAARQIRQACNQKEIESKSQKIRALEEEYGNYIDTAILEDMNKDADEGSGLYSKKYANKSADTTVTFVRLKVGCIYYKEYAYNVKLKPGAAISLVYPSSEVDACVSVTLAYGRPPAWSDFSFSSSAKPLEKNPFSGLYVRQTPEIVIEEHRKR